MGVHSVFKRVIKIFFHLFAMMFLRSSDTHKPYMGTAFTLVATKKKFKMSGVLKILLLAKICKCFRSLKDESKINILSLIN